MSTPTLWNTIKIWRPIKENVFFLGMCLEIIANTAVGQFCPTVWIDLVNKPNYITATWLLLCYAHSFNWVYILGYQCILWYSYVSGMSLYIFTDDSYYMFFEIWSFYGWYYLEPLNALDVICRTPSYWWTCLITLSVKSQTFPWGVGGDQTWS